MKKIITIMLLVVLVLNVTAQVKDSTTKFSWQHNTAIKINLLSLISSFVNIQLEQAISKKSSLNLIYVLGFKDNTGAGSQGFSLGLEYRHYYTGSPTKGGVYLAPFFRYRDISIIQTKTTNSIIQHIPIPYTNYGGGVVLGKQWALFKKAFLIDAFIGPDYNTQSTKNNPAASGDLINLKDFFDPIFLGAGIRTGFTIGYRF